VGEVVERSLGARQQWLLVGFVEELVFGEPLLGGRELGFRHRIFLDEAY
jgi:hypothetical protein